MPSMMDEGLELLREGMAAAAGVTVVASRNYGKPGEVAQRGTITITDAVPGRTASRSIQEGRTRIEYGEREYFIPAASYKLGPGEAVVEPVVGDRFTETIHGVPMTFECSKVNGEKAWEYADAQRTLLQIRCVRVNVTRVDS